MFEGVQGVHQYLGAVLRDEGRADYDLDYPATGAYNFLTIRQVIGLVDWLANADEEWFDGNLLTY